MEQIQGHEGLRTLLKANKRGDGDDLYQHLTQVMNHIVMHCPTDGLDKFEEISFLLKNKDKYNLEDYLKVSEEKRHAKFDQGASVIGAEELIKSWSLYQVSNYSNKSRNRQQKDKKKHQQRMRLRTSPLLGSFQISLLTHSSLVGLELALEKMKQSCL